MRKMLRVFGLLMGLFSCTSNKSPCNKPLIKPQLPPIEDSAMYQRDKKQIEACYLANVEYYRINPQIEGGSVLFEPYGIFWDLEEKAYKKLPTPTEENLQVQIGEIFYSPNKLIALVFLGVKQTIKGPSNIEKPDAGREHDAILLVGLRKKLNENFVLYPQRLGRQLRFPNYEEPIERLKLSLFNCLAKSTNFWGLPYRTNVGDPDFWENNLLFDKVKLSLTGEKVYFFQTYQEPTLGVDKARGNHFLYDVVDCSKEAKAEKNDKTNSLNFLTDPFERKDFINGKVPEDLGELYYRE